MYSTKEIFQTKLNENIYLDLKPFHKISKSNIQTITNIPFQGLHIIIKDNILHIIKERQAYENKNKTIVDMLINLTNRYKIPDTEFIIHTGDTIEDKYCALPVLLPNKKHGLSGILYPDFSFNRWDWPKHPEASTENWDIFRSQVMPIANQFPLEKKHKKIFFRGAATNKIRYELYITTKSMEEIFDIDIGSPGTLPNKYVPLKEHYKYLFLLNMPGNATSGRLKYLTVMNSIVYSVCLQHTEFWYHILKDKYHYFNFSGPSYLANMIQVTYEIMDDTTKLKEIINNMKEIKTFFTMDTVYNYLYNLIIEYTKKLTYEVKLP